MNIEKIASNLYKKAEDSSYLKDFISGVEPTGVYTFENATKNKKNHGKHKAVGDVGGFLGGYALSTLSTAAGMGALGLGAKKLKPDMASSLMRGAKNSLEALRPKKLHETMKKLPEASSISRDTGKIFNKADDIVDKAKVKSKAKTLNPQDITDKAEEAVNLMKRRKAYKGKHGTSPEYDFAKGVTALGGVAVGTLGGGLNALSAHTQYNAGKNLADKQKKKKK